MILVGGCIKSASIAPARDYREAYIDARSTLLTAAVTPQQVARAGASEGELASIQMNALEALGQTLGTRAGGTYMQALSDRNPFVRFAAAMAIGDCRYAPAKDRVSDMAAKAEPNRIVLCAVIYAAHVLGNTQHSGQLGALLFDREYEVRASAALVMGRMGEPSAIAPLKRLLAIETVELVRIQAQESMAILGDPAAAMRIEAATKVPADAQLPAIDALGRIAARGDTNSWRALRVLENLLPASNPPRVRITAAGALARAGEVDDEAYALCVLAVRRPGELMGGPAGARGLRHPGVEEVMLQRLAAISLGMMKRTAAVDVLHPLLNHSDGALRVAAAMAILKLLPSYAQEEAPPVKPAVAAQPAPGEMTIRPAKEAPPGALAPAAAPATPAPSAPVPPAPAAPPASAPAPAPGPTSAPATEPSLDSLMPAGKLTPPAIRTSGARD
jgi:HEAT repeat protein